MQPTIESRQSAIENIEIDLLLEAVHRRYGYDFRSYSRAAVDRRVRQFLSGSGCGSIMELIDKVLRDENLFSNLVQYFSVAVTEMFRDPFVYKVLREQVIPVLRTWPHPRAWCAGCATGEEVYSLSIVLRETDLGSRVRIYATDFNDASLAKAKRGVYEVEKIKEATRNYQKSGGELSFGDYYHAHYGAAVMDPALKESITFANHNLVSDEVFAETHLVFCRNVLIYFNRDLQNRALNLFTQSLVHGGFLCLGTKEDIRFTDVNDQYEVLDKKAKIYRKKVF